MSEAGIGIGLIVIIIAIVEWQIGKYLGQHLSGDAGIIVGIVLILCGVSILIGIPCIVYRGKNKKRSLDLNVNLTKAED